MHSFQVRIDFHPTVPHCSLASLIGLCLRNKIKRDVVDRIKLDIVIAEGKHSTEEESTTHTLFHCFIIFRFFKLLFNFLKCSQQANQWQGTSGCCHGEPQLEGNCKYLYQGWWIINWSCDYCMLHLYNSKYL